MDETPPNGGAGVTHQTSSWVFQHQVWVDRSAVEHEIESMPLHNVQAVIGHCHHQAHRIVTVAVWKQSTHSDECLVDCLSHSTSATPTLAAKFADHACGRRRSSTTPNPHYL